MEKPSESKRWDLWLLVGQKDDFDETSFLDHLGSAKTLGVNPKMGYFLGEFGSGQNCKPGI